MINKYKVMEESNMQKDKSVYWSVCKETGKHFKTQRAFLNNLRTIPMTTKEYYNKHFKAENEGLCSYCNKPTSYGSWSYRKYCSDSCSNKDPKFRKLISERFNNPETLRKYREKRKPWSQETIDKSLAKRRDTISKHCEKEGISESEYYSSHAKKGAATIDNKRRKEITLKGMNTKLKNGTVNAFRGNTYKLVKLFDEEVSVQGYEPIVIKYLLDTNAFNPGEIIAGKAGIPIVDYKDDFGKDHMYFPDIFLPKLNLLIEVKSEYTLNMNKHSIYNKCRAAIASDYSILLLTVSQKATRNGILDGNKNLIDWAISSQASNPHQAIWYEEGSTTIPNGSTPKWVEIQNNPSGLVI